MKKRKPKSKKQLRADLDEAEAKVMLTLARLFRVVTRLKKNISAAKWAARKVRESRVPKPPASPGPQGRSPTIVDGKDVNGETLP